MLVALLSVRFLSLSVAVTFVLSFGALALSCFGCVPFFGDSADLDVAFSFALFWSLAVLALLFSFAALDLFSFGFVSFAVFDFFGSFAFCSSAERLCRSRSDLFCASLAFGSLFSEAEGLSFFLFSEAGGLSFFFSSVAWPVVLGRGRCSAACEGL